ncbi:MAG: SDR family oxidoreductase [Candidatus Hydrothermia bacterium]|jgi:short-subunit dehydrogenase
MNILITGASSGIGKSTYELLKKDYNVIGISRNGPDLFLDLRNVENIKKIKEFLIEKSLKIDVLINNMGNAYVKPFSSNQVEEIEEQIDLNLKSHILITKLLIENINENGIIINIGSIASKIAFENWAVYSASKFGIKGFSNALRKELSKKNIRVSLIMPGAVWTPIWERNKFRKTDDMLMPEDIAKIIKFIIELPSYVNIDEIVITHLKRAY